MYTRVLGLTMSALILAYGAVGAIAQERMTPQPGQQQTQSHPTGEEGTGTMGQGMMGQGMMCRGMMGGGVMGRGMMGGGMMGGSAMGVPDDVPHDVRSDGRWRRGNFIAGVSGGS
jgi:hypothetical protein